MKFSLLAVLMPCTVILGGCSEANVNKEAEAQELMQLSRDWSAMVEAGDFEASIDIWADDAIMLPPDLPVLTGKSEIRDYVLGAASIPGFQISWEPESAHISDGGDMAYLIERNVIEVEGENGEIIKTHGKVLTVWRKDLDGQWKNVVDMWNAAPPPAN